MPGGGSFVFIILATFSSLHPLIEMTSDLRAIFYHIVHTQLVARQRDYLVSSIYISGDDDGYCNISILLVSVLLFKSPHSVMIFAFTFYSFTNWSDV